MAREQSFGAWLENLERKADSILGDFAEFTHGTRVLLLLLRAKEGGHNKEFRRRRAREVVHTKEELRSALLKLLILQDTATKEHRIYMSVSPRDIKKAEKEFKTTMLQTDFDDGLNKQFFWQHLEEKWISALMSTNPTKGDGLFVLDIDKPDNGEALKWCGSNNVEVLKAYRTKNGWHLIVKPFNKTIFPKEIGEIKDDGLILLSY